MIDLKPATNYVKYRTTIFLAYHAMWIAEKLYKFADFFFTKSVLMYSKTYRQSTRYEEGYWSWGYKEEATPKSILNIEFKRRLRRKRNEY